ncbi:MAG: LacI family DNA-binding transcriptional regulator [Kiritimatiellia bacterium]
MIQRQRKITLRDVAKEAGVSCGAACAALRGGRLSTTSVGTQTVEKVLAAANRLGYVPDAAARSLRCQRVSQIGVILPNMPSGNQLDSPQSFETIIGINNELQISDRVLLLARIHDIVNPKNDSATSILFRERMIDIAIVVGQLPKEAEQWILTRLPRVIWCDSRIWSKRCCVRRDEEDAARISVLKIAEAGIRSILLPTYSVPDPDEHFSYSLRLVGIEKTCRETGLSFSYISYQDLISRCANRKTNKKNVAILAYSFDIAQKAYLDLMKVGCIPGKDISLVACDNYRLQWWLFQDIAKVDFDREEMGKAAARLALRYSQDGVEPESVLLPSEWREPNPETSTLIHR